MNALLTMERVAPSPAAPRNSVPRYRALPPIFYIVLIQAELRRRRRGITEETFAAQLSRLASEELEPRSLELLVRRLPCGTTRFIVKAMSTGSVCDMIDCPPDGKPLS
ncbi:MAG: hypothetical protein ABJF10_21625 [Chthoniobacter sp.]|uniref:hypothetical protein n=1 Tax=Chthoniobacter sp. TaxID=2510640 RepID=UPI0032A65F2A